MSETVRNYKQLVRFNYTRTQEGGELCLQIFFDYFRTLARPI